MTTEQGNFHSSDEKVESNPWVKMTEEVRKNTPLNPKSKEKTHLEEDTSFTELLKEDIFEQLSIDEGLRPSFKRVLTAIQAYFNANNYSKNKDYKKLLHDCLVADSDSRMPIRYADLREGFAGHYVHRRNSNKHYLEIDEGMHVRRTDEENDLTLCHEFIHFLVKRGNYDEEFADNDIMRGGFINEALTESLARQIMPNSGSTSYDPQVKMLEFANIMTGQKNNYELFFSERSG